MKNKEKRIVYSGQLLENYVEAVTLWNNGTYRYDYWSSSQPDSYWKIGGNTFFCRHSEDNAWMAVGYQAINDDVMDKIRYGLYSLEFVDALDEILEHEEETS